MSVPFDPRPLAEPVDPAAAKAFRQQLISSGRLPRPAVAAGWIVAIVGGIVGLFVFGGAATSVVVSVAAATASGDVTATFGALFAAVPGVIIVAVAAVLVSVGVRAGGRTESATWLRLDRFARANGMTFEPRRADPPLPGMIFSQGDSRVASNLVRGTQPRFVEFANYRYTTGSGKNRSTHTWGYVAVHLSTPLPHIVLDAVGNNGVFGSNLPVWFGRDQHLSLEGDFDRYFRLYCPAGYERDALYLFTPDIMARFVDHAAALDVEIVDDWMFFYGKRDFSTLDPATWAWLFGAVAAMIDKFSQWERWRDDRLRVEAAASAPSVAPALPPTLPSRPAPGALAAQLPPPAPGAPALPVAAPVDLLRPPPGVAAPGQRLRRTFPWPAIVLLAIVGATMLGGPIVAALIAAFSVR